MPFLIDVLPGVYFDFLSGLLAISSADSEYAGIALLFSVPAFGQLATEQRSHAGFVTLFERTYHWILVFIALTRMYGRGLNFLRVDTSALKLSSTAHYSLAVIIY